MDFSHGRKRYLVTRLLLAGALLGGGAASASAQKLDEMSLERWEQLREVERHQLQIAERYYRQQDWKIALAEYEKYLTLYEVSEAAPFAQLKWSHCQSQLRNQNTAIHDGYQSVIDYWPDSPEAIAAAYHIGQVYKGMGRLTEAKQAYRKVLDGHGAHLVAVLATVDLIDIANVEKDPEAMLEMQKRLTFDVKRTPESERLCEQAARELASHYFDRGAFSEGVKALATTYAEDELSGQVVAHANQSIARLAANEETKSRGDELAATAIAYVRRATPEPTDDEQKQRARQHGFWVAQLHAHAGHDAEVVEAYGQILDQFGADDEVLGRLAGWHSSQDRFDEARQTYRRFADKVEGLRQVAASYRKQQQREQAIKIYQELVQLAPEQAIQWKAEIAQTHHEARQYPQAIEVYEALAVEDVERADQWRWKIATAYQDSGKFKEAIGHYRVCTNFPQNYQQMAACERALKRYGEAIALYQQVAAGHPDSAPWALLQVGHTYEDAGKKEQAIKAFQQVCKRFPKDAHASQAHAHLQTKYEINVTLGGATSE